MAEVFLDELLRNGVTTSLTFATSHPASVQAFFEAAQRRQLRMITGKVLQDRHSPDGVRDQTEQSLIDTEALIRQWHNVDRLGYAITPRFAPTSTDAQLRGAGELAAKYPDTWIHSHVAENKDEVKWARELFPAARSYLDVYAGFGLMRERAVYAHCIHFDDDDRAPDARDRRRLGRQPDQQPVPGQRLLRLRGRRPHRLSTTAWPATSAAAPASAPSRTMLAAYYVGREGPDQARRQHPAVAAVVAATRAARRARWGWTASSATCSRAARPTSW